MKPRSAIPKFFAITLLLLIMVMVPIAGAKATVTEVVVSPAVNLTNTGNSSGDGYFERAPALLKAQSGTWYLAYSKSQTSFTHAGNPDADLKYDIYIKTSTDSGSTWSGETKILDAAAIGTTSSFRSSTLVEADGKIWAIGADIKSLEGDIYASTFNGSSWSSQSMIFNGTYATGAFHVDAVAEGSNIRLFYGIQNESLGVGYILYHGDTDLWDTSVTQLGTSAAYQLPKAVVAGSTYYVVSTDWAQIWLSSSATPSSVPWPEASHPYTAATGYYTADPSILKYGDSGGTADLIIFHSPGSESDSSQWLEYLYSTDSGSTWSSSIPFSDAMHTTGYSWDMESHAYLKDATTIMVVYSMSQRGMNLGQSDIVVSEFKIADIGKPHYTTLQDGIDNVDSNGNVTSYAGTFTEQITIKKSLDLIGAGEGTTTIVAPITRTGSVTHNAVVHDYLLAAYATTSTIDVRIEGFTLDINGQNKSAGTAQIDGVFLRDIKNMSGTTAGLHSCTIHNFAATPDYESWGVEVFGDSLMTINDNDIHDYTRDGLLVSGDDNLSSADPNLTISNNVITGSPAPLNGINIKKVTSGTVSANTVTENTRSTPWAGGGIIISTSAGLSVTGNHVDGNFYGIDLSFDSHDITITGNELEDNIKRGITLNNSDNNIVSGNTISGPLGGTDDVGIGLVNTSTGNMIGGTTLSTGNTISMATSGAGNLYAIYMQADVGAGSNTIRYNTITGGKRAIQFDGPPGITASTTVSNNIITGPSWGGITAYNNGNLIITDNILTNAVRPFEFFGPVDLTVTGNTIHGSTFAGVNLGSFSGTANISDNVIHGIVDSYGIWAQTSGAGLTIADNTIYDISESAPPESPTYAGRGIQIEPTADGAVIDGNEVYNNSSFAGICIVTGATGAHINNNFIHDNIQGVAANGQIDQFDGNRVINNRWGVDLNSAGTAFTMRFNSITGNNAELDSYGLGVWAASVDAENNWWGCNEGPTTDGSTDCDTIFISTGSVDTTPWLILKLDAPFEILKGINYGVSASLTTNSLDEDTSLDGHVLDGIESLFTTTLGSINPTAPTSLNGIFSTVISTNMPGSGNVCVTVDSEQICSSVLSKFLYYLSIIIK